MSKARKPTDTSAAAASRAKASSNIGPKLRQAREHKNMSVRGLARYVGVSPSLVSQIERGRVMPSVGTLYSIANELGLVVDDLFTGAQPRGRKAERGEMAAADVVNPVLKSGQRKTIKLADGVRWERLTPTPDKDVEFLVVVYDVGAESCPKDALIRHGGNEYAYMISGRLGIKIGFEEFELGPGDSIAFDAQMPHRLWTVGREPAEAIWVVLNRHGDARQRDLST
ncbi:MAG TPA: XRE family transcriptional regulator [Vicinamibacterales bacterium]|nr:XRE family transcriptional regulator [Vicinamibacterales bacterium]